MSKQMQNASKIALILSENLHNELDKVSVIEHRSRMAHSLIKSYNLFDSMTIIEPKESTESDLANCHSSDYIECLKQSVSKDLDDCDEEFGLGYDCPRLPNLFKFVTSIAGSTLYAVDAILGGGFEIAINWFGGWHHAQRDQAAGFCYVNDAVVGIQRLCSRYKKVLYVDLDVHHGDGVQEAFYYSKRVLTLSFHLRTPGFFPGTGDVESCGAGNGRGYCVNAPFKPNMSEERFRGYFKEVATMVFETFQPEVCVIQCGGDILAGDPLGGANLTPEDLKSCFELILSWKVPKVFLGGGGYDRVNVSKYWIYLTALICGIELDSDIPESDEFFLDYGPDYTLEVSKKNVTDFNDEEELKQNVIKIKEILENKL